jgi:hypothetical protein
VLDRSGAAVLRLADARSGGPWWRLIGAAREAAGTDIGDLALLGGRRTAAVLARDGAVCGMSRALRPSATARPSARDIAKTEEYAVSRRQRKKRDRQYDGSRRT